MSRFLSPLVCAALAVCALLASPSAAENPVPVFDLHSDILLRVIDNGVDLGDPPGWAQVSIPTMREGHVRNQVLAVWINSRTTRGPEATLRAMQMIDLFEEQADRYSEEIALATNVAEAERITESGRIATWLWLEGGAPIAEDLAALRTFHRLGVRGMTLTWSDNLDWAGSSTDSEDDDKGLTPFGEDVVREMNRLGMVVDISHVSDRTFADVMRITTDPVVASHSGCRALADHPRNLSDDQLRALAGTGGVIGIVALPGYLDEAWEPGWEAAEARIADHVESLKEFYGNTRDPRYREARRLAIQGELAPEATVTLDTYLDHIDHAAKVAGWEHVALGSDFDGMWAFPVGLEKPSKWQAVSDGLRDRGYTEEQIRGIMHDNTRRVFREVIDE